MPDGNALYYQHPGTVGPVCVFQRAAQLTAEQRGVMILHDEGENSTIARLRTMKFAKELENMDVIAYYRNGPRSSDESPGSDTGFDDIASYRCSWLGATRAERDNTLVYIRNSASKKGSFCGLLALGQTSAVARAIAVEHGLTISSPTSTPTQDRDSSSSSSTSDSYPVILLTPQAAYEFHVRAPTEEDLDSPDADSDIPLPLEFILSQIKEAVKSRQKIYDFKRPTIDDLRAKKAAQKAADAAYAKARELERKERREAYARMATLKASGEDASVKLPPSQLKAKRAAALADANAGLKPRKKQQDDSGPSQSSIASSSRTTGRDQTAFSNYQFAPEAAPVTPCSLESLTPMIEWLNLNQDIEPKQEPRIDFTKGSILGKTTHGGGTSVDLCKQVVGPKGIKPILDAVANNEHIDRFLLGNNVVTDEGAKVIADFILDERSKRIYNFYIAGNSITHRGISLIADALTHDTKVTALWLKRNNLGMEGASHIARMLSQNTTLQVLDLVNTNIGDQGAKHVFLDGLAKNPNSAVRHLYMGTSHHGVETAEAAAQYLKTGLSKLRSLYISMSRFGDEGAKALAAGLAADDDKIARLGISSCRIGPEGAKALFDSLRGKKNLVSLDLGWRVGTYELGEKGNCIGDEGVMYLGEALLSGDNAVPLRTLDIAKNDISFEGLTKFVETYILPNKHIVHMPMIQRGTKRNAEMEAKVREVCKRNRQAFNTQLFEARRSGGGDVLAELERIQDAIDPLHVKEIYSIYRGNM